jgi:hypothetical protein
MELTQGIPGGIRNNLLAIQAALEGAGVISVPAGKDGVFNVLDVLEDDLAKSEGPVRAGAR